MTIKNGKIYNIEGCSLVLIVTAKDPSGNTTVVRRTIGEIPLAPITESSENLTELLDKDVFIFPNPSNGSFEIKLNNFQLASDIYLLDITGKIVEKKSIKTADLSSTILINDHKLPNGIYILKVVNNETTRTKKVIIQRE